MQGKKLILTIVLAIVLAGGGFTGGYFYGKNQRSDLPAGFAGGPGNGIGTPPQMGGTQARGGGGSMTGEIISKSDSSITVKDSDGNTKIVYFSDSTKASKGQDVAISSLTTGESVAVMGSSNSDGSITAQTIMLQSSGS